MTEEAESFSLWTGPIIPAHLAPTILSTPPRKIEAAPNLSEHTLDDTFPPISTTLPITTALLTNMKLSKHKFLPWKTKKSKLPAPTLPHSLCRFTSASMVRFSVAQARRVKTTAAAVQKASVVTKNITVVPAARPTATPKQCAVSIQLMAKPLALSSSAAATTVGAGPKMCTATIPSRNSAKRHASKVLGRARSIHLHHAVGILRLQAAELDIMQAGIPGRDFATKSVHRRSTPRD